MPFVANDPNINRRGRKPRDLTKRVTNRELKERELLMLLRRVKPHVAEAILQAARIMKNAEASHQNQLKAATLLLENYRRLTLDLYDGEDADPDGEGEAVQESAPVFSLKVIENKPE